MLHGRIFAGVLGLAALVVLGASGLSFAGGLTMERVTGDVTVKISFDADTVPVDEVGMAVSITDEAGKPVNDAKVRVYYGMAAMPGMPPMDYKTKTTMDADVYRAKLDFSMAGPWYVEVKFKRPGDEELSKAKFNVDVH